MFSLKGKDLCDGKSVAKHLNPCLNIQSILLEKYTNKNEGFLIIN